METLLFKDSEIFIKERPTKLSEKQETEIWQKLAKEVIDNGWSDDDIKTIIEDLQGLSMSDSGYEMAKDLEGFRSNGHYDIDTAFIEWLDMLDRDFYYARYENVKQWVKAHDIKPKYEIGTQLIVKEHFTRSQELQVGKVIFINGYYEKEAKYCVSNEKDSKRNVVIIYENIERCCVVS
jgi:hypothetical protein